MSSIQLIRHATLLLDFGGVSILVDPFLAPKDTYDPIIWTSNGIRNPMTELPFPAKDSCDNADIILVTHTHNDHWDEAARQLIAKEKLLLGQPEDEAKFREQGFTNVHPIVDKYTTHGLIFQRTGGQHGTGEIALKMAPVSGFVISDGKRSLYIAGDTIWCSDVAEAINKYQPDVVVLNTGGAQFDMGDPITMTAADVLQVAAASKASKIICVHMDTVNHCYVTRPLLRAAVGGDGRILLPEDGETVAL